MKSWFKRNTQQELGGSVSGAFNLVQEQAEDPERIARERLEAKIAAAAAAEYQARMQRTFSNCPGFTGGDMPSGDGKRGVVVIDPAHAQSARIWLKRRFCCNESVELSEQGLCFEVVTRVRGQSPKRKRPAFGKPEQFELSL